MQKSSHISCTIKDNKVWLNESLVFEGNPNDTAAVFFNQLYKHLQISYPKFFKMDLLSKLGFLASEILIKNTPDFISQDKDKIALLFSNRSSSLESDESHAASIADKQNYFPSPSIFVYTLPNIGMGEIAIRHKLTGENAFFVSEKFDKEFLDNYARILYAEGQTNAAVCGWIDYHQNNYEAFVYYTEKGTFNL